MPLLETKAPFDKKAYQRGYMRRRRAKARGEAHQESRVTLSRQREAVGADEVDKLCAWARRVLRVPAGHPLAGQPMEVPDFGADFLRDALRHRESLLCLGRKNAKSAIVAVYLLGRLVGPIAIDGWRGGVCSVNREKAGELKAQVEAIARASGLVGLEFWRSPAPGRVTSSTGELTILSADKSAGHAAGFDDAIVDELGLLAERDRALVNGMKSSTSARNGRFLALSIRGDAPFTAEMIEAADDPGVAVHLHQAPEGCDLEDPAAWAQANPGLGTIKSVDYMRDRARLAARNPNDAADFMAHDLNRPGEPRREMICTLSDWKRVAEVEQEPERRGPVVVGLDAGGSSSMTAAVAIWPQSGRVEVRGAFPATPDLIERGRLDGVGRRYAQLHDSGELQAYPGRSTPVTAFLRDLADDLQGVQVIQCGADRFRQSEIADAVSDARLRWPMVWRGQGASATADGSADVRSFQRFVADRSISIAQGKNLMAHAISESAIRRDGSGNPALERGRQRGRIDALSAAVIAAGLAERYRSKMKRTAPKPRYAIAR